MRTSVISNRAVKTIYFKHAVELRTQKFIQHNTRVKNVQQCYCIKMIKYFNIVIFMYYVMEIEQRLFNR